MGKTKIVATIGPASSGIDVLKKIVKIGVSIIRINTAHADLDYVKKIKKDVDQINKDLKSHVGIMLDLKGPELRTVGTENFRIEANKEYFLSSEKINENTIMINRPEIIKSIKKNDTILMSDGKVSFKVLYVDGNGAKIKALNSEILRDRARINIPGRYIDLGILTDRDMQFLIEGIKDGVDFFALSFVQNRMNVQKLQKTIIEYSGDQAIISKIETKSGLENLSEIVKVSDAIMVARGDLGVELPLEEIGIVQKNIIREVHKYGIPTIVATQMLESMVNESSPTRAEVSDITNAILDNADAVMLSEETAIGKYPELAVMNMKKIIDFVESRVKEFPEPEEFFGNKIAFSIAKATKMIAKEIDANGILGFTSQGNTAKMLSAVRPGIPVYMAVTNDKMARKLNLLRGINPFIIGDAPDFNQTLKILKESFKIKKGSRLVVASGAPYFHMGGTNSVMVITMGEFIGRGYTIGKSFSGKLTISGEKGDVLLVKNRVTEIDDRFLKFKGIIFLENVAYEVMEYLEKNRVNALYNTKFYSEPKEGLKIFVDSHTGTIII